jgi:hypothetical protein
MFDRALRPRFLSLVVLFTFGLFVAADADAPTRPDDPGTFNVHEWGTFTSIAGPDGAAMGWTPLSGANDLPCFVNRMQFGPKWSLRGTVRMETPVLYFYSAGDVTVDVNVRFNQGVITEWFPQAKVSPAALPEKSADGTRRLADYAGIAKWTTVKVRPGAAPDFLREASPSHYYPARDTDAAPVQVGNALERFLFYRGVGEFAPPVTALVQPDRRIIVRAAPRAAVGDVVLFDNRGGTVRFLARSAAGSEVILDPSQFATGSAAVLNQHLERVLIAHGLYPKEARAMIATWRDTWFEEGSRLFYIAPREAVDAVLPLEIAPRPADVARVFVGRIELMTQETLADLKGALLTNDQRALAKYGRFLEPFMERVFADSSHADQMAMAAARQAFYSNWRPPRSTCES